MSKLLNAMFSLFDQILSATQVQQVTDIVTDLSDDYEIAWKPVGGTENNLATINLGSDPAAGVVERITNAIDAVLDREWMERGQPGNVLSPRQAVQEWFGVVDGRLADIDVRDPATVELRRQAVDTAGRDGGRRRG